MFFLPKEIRQRFETNRDRDISGAADANGMLNGQGRAELAKLAFGRSNVGRAGCESIAVYNVLRLLGRPRPLAEIIRDMEKGGYLRMGGHWGASPWLQLLLRRYGTVARVVTARGLQRAADVRALTPGAVFIMCIWNRRFMPQKGLHTFAAVYDPRGEEDWVVFNRYNNDAQGRRYAAVEDILKTGKTAGAFLVIYRVYPQRSEE